MVEMKVCSKCGIEKSIAEYYANPAGRGGLSARCKDCHKDAVRKYREENPERVAAFLGAYNKKYYRDNKGKLKAARDQARDRMSQRIAAGDNFGMDGGAIRCRLCELLRPVEDFHRSSSHRTGRQSICKHCNSRRNKEAYRRGRRELLDFLGGRCACCGEREPAFLEIDHVNGGGGRERKAKNSLANLRNRVMNTPSDFQVLCANCHVAKSTVGECPHKASERAAHEA